MQSKRVSNSNAPNPDTEFPQMKYYLKVFPEAQGSSLCQLKNSPKKPKNVEIGDFTYAHSDDFFNNLIYNWGENKLVIGKFCSIAYKASFCFGGNHNHNPEWISTYPFESFQSGWEKSKRTFERKSDITIGNDVWFGYDCHIMPGVNIGDGAIIAAKAVVSKDVEPYTIVGGSPAKVIRKRFCDSDIKKLQEIKWWNWDVELIRNNLDVICSPDIEALYARYKKLFNHGIDEQ